MGENEASVILTLKDNLSEGVRKAGRATSSAFARIAKSAKRAGIAVGAFASRVVGSMRRVAVSVASVAKGIFSLGNSIKALVVGALIFGVVKGFDALISRGADVKRVAESFEALTGGAKGFGNELLTKTRKATKGLVDDLTLMRQANNAILLGLPASAEGFAELAASAVTLGRAVGRDANDAITDLTTGIGRQSRLILDNLGLVVRVEQANKDYARSINKTADNLTLLEQRQAFFNAAMDAARTKSEVLGGITLDAADRWQILKNQLTNTFNAMVRGIASSGVLAKIFEKLSSRIDGMGLTTDETAKKINRFAIIAVKAGTVIGQVGLFMATAFEGARLVVLSIAGALNKVIGFISEDLLTGLFKVSTAIADVAQRLGFEGTATKMREIGAAMFRIGQDIKFVTDRSAEQNFDSAATAAANVAALTASMGDLDQMSKNLTDELEANKDVVLKGAGASGELEKRVEDVNADLRAQLDVLLKLQQAQLKANITAESFAQRLQEVPKGSAAFQELFKQAVKAIPALEKLAEPDKFQALIDVLAKYDDRVASITGRSLIQFGDAQKEARVLADDFFNTIDRGNLSVGEQENLIKLMSGQMSILKRSIPADEFKRLELALERLGGLFGGTAIDKFNAGQRKAVQEASSLQAALRRGTLTTAEQGFAYGELVDRLDRVKVALGENSAEFQGLLHDMRQVRDAQEEMFRLTPMEEFAEGIGLIRDELGDYSKDFRAGFIDMAAQASDAMAQMFADVLSGATTLGEGIKQVGLNLVNQMLAMLIKMGIQRVVLALINKTATAVESSAQISAGLGGVYVNSFASAAAIPLVGWAIAPGIAATNLGVATAGVSEAMSAGAALGSGAAAAEGGTTRGPVRTLIGEAGQEAIIPLQGAQSRKAAAVFLGSVNRRLDEMATAGTLEAEDRQMRATAALSSVSDRLEVLAPDPSVTAEARAVRRQEQAGLPSTASLDRVTSDSTLAPLRATRRAEPASSSDLRQTIARAVTEAVRIASEGRGGDTIIDVTVPVDARGHVGAISPKTLRAIQRAAAQGAKEGITR